MDNKILRAAFLIYGHFTGYGFWRSKTLRAFKTVTHEPAWKWLFIYLLLCKCILLISRISEDIFVLSNLLSTIAGFYRTFQKMTIVLVAIEHVTKIFTLVHISHQARYISTLSSSMYSIGISSCSALFSSSCTKWWWGERLFYLYIYPRNRRNNFSPVATSIDRTITSWYYMQCLV